jgi:hypothetical protein
MLGHLPRLPGAEPLDLRILGGFLALLAILLAPSGAAIITPTSAGDVSDDLATLESSAREARALIDARRFLIGTYVTEELGTLVEKTRQSRKDVLDRPFAPDVAARRSRYLELANAFIGLMEPLAENDDAALLTSLRYELTELEERIAAAEVAD